MNYHLEYIRVMNTINYTAIKPKIGIGIDHLLLLFPSFVFSDSIRFVVGTEMAAATLQTLCSFWIVRASIYKLKGRSASTTYDKTCL